MSENSDVGGTMCVEDDDEPALISPRLDLFT